MNWLVRSRLWPVVTAFWMSIGAVIAVTAQDNPHAASDLLWTITGATAAVVVIGCLTWAASHFARRGPRLR